MSKKNPSPPKKAKPSKSSPPTREQVSSLIYAGKHAEASKLAEKMDAHLASL